MFVRGDCLLEGFGGWGWVYVLEGGVLCYDIYLVLYMFFYMRRM